MLIPFSSVVYTFNLNVLYCFFVVIVGIVVVVVFLCVYLP